MVRRTRKSRHSLGIGPCSAERPPNTLKSEIILIHPKQLRLFRSLGFQLLPLFNFVAVSLLRTLVSLLALVALAPAALAAAHPTGSDVRSETAAPTLPGLRQAARRATATLPDALRLSTVQVARLQASTEAELRALVLAATPADAAAAERGYLLALGRVLNRTQFVQYCALRGSLQTPLAFL